MNEAGPIPFIENAPYPVREGNRVAPLVDGEPAFRRICEAVEAARYSVWVTVAFVSPDFQMPDRRGDFFDVLTHAASRGVDVRVLFWRNREGSGFPAEEIFSGSRAHHAMLSRRCGGLLIRWDMAQKAYCQHQKSWIVDAGQDGETAFVGGINLYPSSMVPSGHRGGRQQQTHDVYVEVTGPCATDVHHNFAQRWNYASERDLEDGCWPDRERAHDLRFPTVVSPSAGTAVAEVQRTVRAGDYGLSAPEHTIFAQYRQAIAAAHSSIYIEDQALGAPEIVDDLHAALERGVEVVCLVPAEGDGFLQAARRDPRSKAFFERLGELDRHERFALVGIAAPDAEGNLRTVYVHDKIMLIDDQWATIGSCNIGARSFFGDTELNLSFYDPATVKALRVQLLDEHLAADTSVLSDREAMALYRERAVDNARRIKLGNPLDGLAFRLDAARFGEAGVLEKAAGE